MLPVVLIDSISEESWFRSSISSLRSNYHSFPHSFSSTLLLAVERGENEEEIDSFLIEMLGRN